jgi:hypothetical protein
LATPDEDSADNLLWRWQEELVAEADELKRDIQEKSHRLKRIEEELSLLTKLLELRGTGSMPDQVQQEVRNRVGKSLLSEGPQEFEDNVEQILRNRGEPMHISTIRESLIEAGYQIPGRGDEANIIVRIRKHPERFTRTARGTYALTEWGIPELKTSTRRSRPRKAS